MLMLLVVIGSYHPVDNFKIQDMYVDNIGTQSPISSTGVIQRPLAATLGLYRSAMEGMATAVRIIREGFVPLDVRLIDLLNNHFNK